MTYSEFTLEKVKKEFGLIEKRIDLFGNTQKIESSNWLKETLEISLDLALSSSSEKARSEFIIAPILIEMEKRNNQKFAVYSGERLDIDEDRGLKGECDFILTKGPISSTIQSPIFSMVEAKKSDIHSGLGQCVAQMIGAKLFNQKEQNDINTIFGCVTTGEDWQFLKLKNDVIFMDKFHYYINEVEKILAIFQNIIDNCISL